MVKGHAYCQRFWLEVYKLWESEVATGPKVMMEAAGDGKGPSDSSID